MGYQRAHRAKPSHLLAATGLDENDRGPPPRTVNHSWYSSKVASGQFRIPGGNTGSAHAATASDLATVSLAATDAAPPLIPGPRPVPLPPPSWLVPVTS
jgi:hypothetical protein